MVWRCSPIFLVGLFLMFSLNPASLLFSPHASEAPPSEAKYFAAVSTIDSDASMETITADADEIMGDETDYYIIPFKATIGALTLYFRLFKKDARGMRSLEELHRWIQHRIGRFIGGKAYELFILIYEPSPYSRKGHPPQQICFHFTPANWKAALLSCPKSSTFDTTHPVYIVVK